jgi:O-antigen ligase
MARALTAPRDHLETRSTLAAGAGVLTGALVGMALAVQIPLGLALLVAAVYLPLLFVNFPLAVCLWIPVVFLEGIPAFNLAGKAAGLLLVVAWVGTLLTGSVRRTVFARHRRLLEVFGVFIVWLTLSLAWAPDTGQAVSAAWQWWAVAFVFLIVATSIAREQTLVLAVGMYVAGAALSVIAAAATGGLTSGARLEGFVGSPNFLASALFSAVPLAFALSAVRPYPGWRWLCVGTVVLLTAGAVATQSRGAFIAAFAMWVVAVVVLPRRRQVIALGAVVAVAVAVALALNPQASNRLTKVDAGGTGRVDIWTVAWNVFEDHPVRGVGLSNFGRVAPDYVREVGPLEDVNLIVRDTNRSVHNSYLQFLAENGIFALVLFLVVVVGCMGAVLRAAKLFTDLGRTDLAALAHGVWVGTVGLLAGYFVRSGAVDRLLWILLGISLAALEVAHRMTARAPSLTVQTQSTPPNSVGAGERSARS